MAAVMNTVHTIMIMTTIIKANWQHHQQALKQLREAVFIREQHISEADEWDGKDNTALHYLAFEKGQAIACARMMTSKHIGKIGRVCVLPDFRRQHIATRLLQVIIADANSLKLSTLNLDAQIAVLTLYTALGFQAVGDTFMDASILHQNMTLKL